MPVVAMEIGRIRYWKRKILPFELLEENNVNDVIRNGKFQETYNLAAQSFVQFIW